ncbi:hypothetical protein PIB30_042741 [Stylosanthes scabra]|uniref:Uncharacterized protein n=1 Tax=Stylosanthes scabra TaxID=79078 RepID=A0ABU6SF80_9FABA|nr:hypothetical protein [Stylosanthes scabra]
MPIPATQDVIEINSDDEDPEPRPIKMLILKVEKCVASSPASMLITDVLMSMAENAAIEAHLEEESQPDPSMPSFSLNLDNPTPQAMVPKGGNDYEFIFDLRGPRTLKAMRFQFDSMAPKSYIDIQVVGLMCHILNGEEGERYEKMVYCISP